MYVRVCVDVIFVICDLCVCVHARRFAIVCVCVCVCVFICRRDSDVRGCAC
jgi:hypothetical protein